MNNPTKTELITESSNGARERKSQVTHQFELFNKERMNKIGTGQVTIPFQSKNMWSPISCYNEYDFFSSERT